MDSVRQQLPMLGVLTWTGFILRLFGCLNIPKLNTCLKVPKILS